MTRPAAAPTPPEDELDELPALDGGEEGEVEPDYQDLLDEQRDDAGDPLDDKTSEDADADAGADAKELETAGAESGWLEDAEDADELDVGSDLSHFEGDADAGGDFEELGVGDEDFGLGGAAEDAAGLDAGEEGPADDDEELREADLPPLDADEEGEMDDAELVEPSFGEGLDASLPWAARAWKPVGAPLGVGETSAVVCAEARDAGATTGAPRLGRGQHRVVAALSRAPSLVRVDLEGACEPLATLATRRLVAAGGLVAIVTEDGRARVSHDGGASFALVEGASEVDDVALAGAELWVRTRAGKVTRTADFGKTWSAPLRAARALAIASDGARVVALVREPGGGTRLVDATSAEGEALPEDVAAQVGVGSLLAARGRAAASAGDPRGLSRTLDGVRWNVVDGIGRVTAMVFLDDAGTLLVAAAASEGDASWLVLVDAAGDARIVAEVDRPAASEDGEGDGDAEATVSAMARDEAHGVVWVAGAFGLVAFEIP